MYGITLEYQARKREEANDWKGAAKLWRMCGRISDAEACEFIVESTRKGDEYRSLIAGVDERWERREINNEQHYQLLTEAHNKVYSKV